MFQGLRTAIYYVSDLEQGKAWYIKVLGIQPYFDQPFYIGFNIDGFELGLVPVAPNAPQKTAYVVAYWGVQNADVALQRLLELGATEHDGVKDVGGDIRVASVADPFGNLLGIIENPHFSQK